MKIIIILFILFVIGILYVGYGDDTMAHASKNKRCSVNISSVNNLLPVTYVNNTRNNPDGSFYPGDAFHFLFKYSGSDTCVSFSLQPLVGSDNLTFESALVISDDSRKPRPLTIEYYKWVPKSLETTHYYKVLSGFTPTLRNGVIPSCDRCFVHQETNKGVTTTMYISSARYAGFDWNLVLSDNPIVSIREDQKLSRSELKKIRIDGGGRQFSDIISVTTRSWYLVHEQTKYRIGVDEHVLEDERSVNAFVSMVKSNCSDLDINEGCLFGHVEINTDIDTSRQICLFDELNKRGILFNEDKETDQCISEDLEDEISAIIKGEGIRCSSDGLCKRYTKTKSASITPSILFLYDDIFFKYPHLYDPDGFPGKNNDGTYYLDNPIGIIGTPNALYKESRSGIITFDGVISSNSTHIIDVKSCDMMCNAVLSGQKMSAITHVIENGDMLSAHYASEHLGIAKIKHISKMYNIERLIGVYSGTATPLIVVYKPQITHVDTWSRLADGGYLSFHNRYAIAINYTGSLGGGPDDGDTATIHPDRPVKITDISGLYYMTNHFGDESLDWNPDGVISGAHGLGDMSVHESVYPYIPQDYTFVDTFENPAIVLWNGTISDIMVQSAGYARILKDVEIPEEKLDTYHINVTAYDTLSTRNYGGIPVDYLISSKYNFPWGFFSTPLNVTAYYISANMTSHQDTDVIINHIHATDATTDSEFISTVEFYLNQHDSAEFEYMHMADMYEMNPKISLSDTGTSVIHLNKTGIYFDLRAYNKAVSNKLLGEAFPELTSKDILNASRRDFFTSPSYYDVSISASRDGITSDNTIQMGGVELSNVIKYKLNMHPQNSLSVNKIDDTAMIPHNPYFGDIIELSVNGEPYDRVACGNGCLVLLEDGSQAEFSIENAWGGVATATNVTGVILHDYDPDSWIEDTPMRIFWFAVGLGLMYGMYRGIKMLYKSRK